MGLLIVAGFVVVAAEIARRMSTPNAARPPASGAASGFSRAHRPALGCARGVDERGRRPPRRPCRDPGRTLGGLYRRSAQRRPARHRRIPARGRALAMIDHLSITTTDVDRAQTFYDAVLGALGYPRVYRRPEAIGYGERGRDPDSPPCISIYLCRGTFVPDNRHWAFRAAKPRRRAGVPCRRAKAWRHRRRTARSQAAIQPRLLRSVRARSRWQSHRGRHAPARGQEMNFRSDNEVGAHPAIIEAVSRAFSGGTAPSYGADDWTHRVEQRLRDLFEQARPGGLPGRDRHRRQRAVAGVLHAALGRHLLPPGGAHRGRRGQRAGILHLAAPSSARSTDRRARSTRGSSPRRWPSRSTASSIIRSRPPSASPRRPNAAPSMAPRKSPRSPPRRIAMA